MEQTISKPFDVAAGPSLAQRIFGLPVLLAVALAVIVYLFIPKSMADPDIWWHLRNAEYQVHTHSFIMRDMYSFTAFGAPWMNHEWLAELPFYFGYRWLGGPGISIVAIGAIEMILFGIFYLAYRKSKNIKSAVLVSIVAVMLSTVSFGPRTLLFGWLCLIVELLIFERVTRNEAVIWALPALFLVWVNTHGSWLIGMVLFLVFLVCGSLNIQKGFIAGTAWSRSFRRKLTISYLLSACALFINPYGWRLVAYPFNLAFHQKLNIANVEEWHSLDFHTPRGRILLVCLAIFFIFQLIRPRKWAPYELAFLFIGIYSAFTYTRFLFLVGILVMPILAKSIPWAAPRHADRTKPLINAAILLVLVCLVVGRFRGGIKTPAADERQFPDHALNFLHGFQPKGNVLNDYLWGGYLIWNSRQIPVFVDSRVDIFEYNGTFKDYLDIIHLHDSLALLNKHHIRYVLFEKDAPLVYMLEHTGAWKIDYEDEATVLLEQTLRQN
jgi:hypothetical protein